MTDGGKSTIFRKKKPSSFLAFITQRTGSDQAYFKGVQREYLSTPSQVDVILLFLFLFLKLTETLFFYLLAPGVLEDWLEPRGS